MGEFPFVPAHRAHALRIAGDSPNFAAEQHLAAIQRHWHARPAAPTGARGAPAAPLAASRNPLGDHWKYDGSRFAALGHGACQCSLLAGTVTILGRLGTARLGGGPAAADSDTQAGSSVATVTATLMPVRVTTGTNPDTPSLPTTGADDLPQIASTVCRACGGRRRSPRLPQSP
jgi:hypothetical protein